jgi:hypothetical protein
MSVSYETRVARVNAAFNFYADTKGVDYVTGAMSAAEVAQEDADNARLLREGTMPELRDFGYGRRA